MTPLKKPVTRLTDDFIGRRQLVIRAAPEGLYLKEQGQRWSSAFLIPWSACYHLGARLKARQAQAEKKLKRKRGW